jgi:hypothetical protein
MKRRCYDKNFARYANYGGRGIKVCHRWLNSFEAFHEDMGPRPSRKHTIDRINVEGDYEPGNCRWATPPEQARNTTRTVWIDVDGQKLPAVDAADCRRSKARRKELNSQLSFL